MKKRKKKRSGGSIAWWMFFACLVLLAVSVDVYLARKQLDVSGDWITLDTSSPSPKATPTATAHPIVKSTSTPSSSTLPDHALVTMPFLVQAPFAKWDALHEDACEETSLIMVNHFLKGTPIDSKESGDTEIMNLVHYEESKGYGLSITVDQLKTIAKDYDGLQNGRVETNVTIEDIKHEIAAGRPVIVGAAGKVLANPNFSNGGPNYHMLVVKGYDDKGFITNDPGIRQGENFRYTYDNLYESIHDWDPGDILNGQKAYLTFDAN